MHLNPPLLRISFEHTQKSQPWPVVPLLPFGRRWDPGLETVGGSGGDGDEGEDV